MKSDSAARNVPDGRLATASLSLSAKLNCSEGWTVMDERQELQRLADRLEKADAIVLVELPESGTRRMHNSLSTRDEVLLIKALREHAALTGEM